MGVFSCALFLVAAVGCFACAASSSAHAQPWRHGWDTAGAAWWGDFGYSLLTEAQAAFVASGDFCAPSAPLYAKLFLQAGIDLKEMV